MAPLFPPLANPGIDEEHTQAFHLIVPSLPGLGFSDALQTDDQPLSKTATMLDSLMRRLGYDFYLASGTGSGELDYHLLRLLGEMNPDSCLGTHLIEPCAERPRFRLGEVWSWLKFALARLFNASLFGYTKQDFVTLHAAEERRQAQKAAGLSRGYAGLHMLGLTLAKPHTLSYALTDSPVGLLSLVCASLHKASPNHALTQTQVIDVTQLAWLPGPEAGLRFATAAANEIRALDAQKRAAKREAESKSKVAITVFNAADTYICPAWAHRRHHVLWAQRVPGTIGLAIWERPQVLVDGIRGLASAIPRRAGPDLQRDGEQGIAGDEIVTVHEVGQSESEFEFEADEGEGQGEIEVVQLDVESPDTVVAVDMGRR